MEVPAAFHGLKNRYENLRAKFSFGHFDPVEQGQIFQKEVQHCYDANQNAQWHDDIILLPLPIPSNPTTSEESTATFLLETLWTKFSNM
ncbi:unnamed protein product [Didymodactylos carnosus]|uniref:Uncharacterized protein n=1 Tax=Didymodactylos carnosus TaxID=1234261 RepID=A0A815AU38_9BILA|nr:unnamed protein product [Didymodactylos carnosus]CAF4038059.1 unnamed protein product [Didymodactylos carnosus]